MKKKKLFALILAIAFMMTMATVAFATTGNVAGVIEQTWKSAAQQIKTVVNTVVFPALDMILVILLFVKIATAYLDYRKHGQMEWTPRRYPLCRAHLLPDRPHLYLDHPGDLTQSKGAASERIPPPCRVYA